MTTVINLNLLNFYGQSSGETSRRLNAGVPDRKHHHSSGRERIIDVTRSSRVVSDSEARDEEDSYNPAGRVQDKLARNYDLMNKTYDRSGTIKVCCYPKGMHVDAYV